MSTCANCSGLIAEPGKAYGYAGKWCFCTYAKPERRVIDEPKPDWGELQKRITGDQEKKDQP